MALVRLVGEIMRHVHEKVRAVAPRHVVVLSRKLASTRKWLNEDSCVGAMQSWHAYAAKRKRYKQVLADLQPAKKSRR